MRLPLLLAVLLSATMVYGGQNSLWLPLELQFAEHTVGHPASGGLAGRQCARRSGTGLPGQSGSRACSNLAEVDPQHLPSPQLRLWVGACAVTVRGCSRVTGRLSNFLTCSTLLPAKTGVGHVNAWI
ncbi:hypothetical protein E7T06_07615 [Deinococcus sp. Arct2-2]|uniref:hypothetical protein n=1 Tax=Deinococcus sp. Arct2-2 TaxID=2568653 RepID=UPI0010A5831C|nr:hypothetical protein [Deinococcus sp. Arct2-2]THF70331.1 hypothetical protein E7T06_07615 [Deinococcus sp. Arct2-2]